ncbi:MAG: caspase family protein [Betaproteobacteria bacterium]|nr:caspase family protein [Betaproteobacteria bacterium]
MLHRIRVFLLGAALAWASLAYGQPPRAEVFVQLGHRSAVTAIAFSPDGQRLASAGADGVVKLWDVASGRVAATLRGPGGAILCLAYSPDGALLVTGGRDRVLRLWDARSGAELGAYRGHESVVLAVAFADAQHFVSASYDRTVRLWTIGKPESGVELGRHGEPVRALDVSADGKVLASASEDRSVRLWPLGARSAAEEWRADTGLLSVRLSPDGELVAAGGQDGAIRLWRRAAPREAPRLLRGHAGPVNALAFSADGGLLASASGDGTVRTWDVQGARELSVVRAGAEQQAVAFSPRAARSLRLNLASMVAAGGADRAVRLWSAEGEARETLASRVTEIRSLDFSGDGTALAVGSGDGVRVWDAQRGQLARAFATRQPVESARFSADGALLAASSQDGSVTLWERASGRELSRLDAHKSGAFAVAFSPSSKELATGGRDNEIRIWEVEAKRQKLQLSGHAAAVRDLAYSPDGRLLASCANDDTVRLWEAATGRAIAVLKGHANRVNAVRFSADGTKLVSGSEDSTLKVWDASSGTLLLTLSGHAGPVKALAVSGARILSVSVDETLAAWDLASGKMLAREPIQAGQLAALSASSRGYLAAGGDGGVTVVSRLEDRAERVRLFGFTDGEWLGIVPGGEFSASANGARYLNVRVGNDVYGLDQFLESFLRPESVMAALGGKPDTAPVATPAPAKPAERRRELAQIRPAPEVAIVGVPGEVATGEVNVRVRLADRGGGIGDVRLYLNGSAVVQDRAADRPSGAAERDYLVRLVPGRNVIRAIAFNADNTMQSADAVQELRASMAETGRRPKLHALVVGIQEFVNPRLRLSYSVADANLFADVLESRAKSLFESVDVRRLVTPAQTSRAAITQALREIRARVAPEDLFVFYVASHGTVDEGEYFLLTSNVGATSTDRLRADALGERDLRDLLANIPATKKLILFDTCNAGRIGDVLATRGLEEDRATKVLSRAVGSTVLSAATSLQEALEGYKGHGLFTYVVAEALGGKADYDRDGYVGTTELSLYVENEVPELAEAVFRYKQFPLVSKPGAGMSFPVTRVAP